MQEDENQVPNEEVQEENQEQIQEEEQQLDNSEAPDGSHEDAPEETPEEVEETQPEEEKPSRREQLRVQQLLEKYGPPQAKQEESQPLNYREAIEADDDIYKNLEDDRSNYGKQREEAALRQVEAVRWETMLHLDAPKVEQKYKILDKDSETFNPAVADAVNTWYLKMAGYDPQTRQVANPAVRYADFVEGFMELVDETASEKASVARTNITRQAAQTGLRPDGSQSRSLNLNKAPEQMSDEELDAVIAQAGLSPKKRN